MILKSFTASSSAFCTQNMTAEKKSRKINQEVQQSSTYVLKQAFLMKCEKSSEKRCYDQK